MPIDKNSHIGSSWYRPRLTTDDSALLIKHEQSGTFVVRDTSLGYELSVVHQAKVVVKRIKRLPHALRFEDSKLEFPTFVARHIDVVVDTLCSLAALVASYSIKYGREMPCPLRLYLPRGLSLAVDLWLVFMDRLHGVDISHSHRQRSSRGALVLVWHQQG